MIQINKTSRTTKDNLSAVYMWAQTFKYIYTYKGHYTRAFNSYLNALV